ncbi:MAG: hypothetical protein IKU32_02185 [Clostridia bacterium]|nr:hypothetical protein [Clostridia bacterium]
MATTDYSAILATLGLTNEDAIRAWQKQYGLEETGVWGEVEQAAYDTYGALPFKTAQAIKDYQLSRGIEDTGAWDDATKLAYRQDLAAKGTYSDVTGLADLVLSTYNLPTTNLDEITASVEAYMRNAYDQSIADRKKATEEQRAMIDLDAFSRGMGGSTWVTDAKQRLEDEEADDIAKIEANYQAGLSEAVLNQYNAAVAQGLAAKDNAYALAAQLYNLGQSAKSNVGGISSGGGSGGSGGGYVSTAKKKSSSGSSSSKSSSGSSGIYDSSNLSSGFSNKDVQDAAYKAIGATNYQTKTGTYIGNDAYDAARESAKKNNDNTTTKKNVGNGGR